MSNAHKEHLVSQLIAVNKERTPFPGTDLGRLLGRISGGEVFSSKVNYDGSIKSMKSNEKTELLKNTQMFVKFANSQRKNISGTTLVYRTINISKEIDPLAVFAHPIPFSATWDKKLAEKWQEKSCCLLEIELPNNYPFISFSYPFDLKDLENILEPRFIRNQPQLEVILPPSLVIPTTEIHFETFGKIKTRVVRCIIKKYDTYENKFNLLPLKRRKLVPFQF